MHKNRPEAQKPSTSETQLTFRSNVPTVDLLIYLANLAISYRDHAQPTTGARTMAAKVITACRSPGGEGVAGRWRYPPAFFVPLGQIIRLARARSIQGAPLRWSQPVLWPTCLRKFHAWKSRSTRRQSTSKVVAGNRSIAASGILSEGK